MIDPVLCQAALDALAPFDNPEEFTADERIALRFVREAIESIRDGKDITPTDGPPWKMRLIRHIAISYFIPSAPRPPNEPTSPPGGLQ